MSIPREFSRDTSEGYLISIYPDVCLTPVGSSYVPIPYTIVAKQSDDANTCPTVRATKKRVHTMGSIITKCSGDAAGTGKGVKSGTIESVCHPKEHSSRVRACGHFVIRQNDVWYMNNKNTQGKLNYVKRTDIDQLTPPIYFADQQADDGADTSASGSSDQPPQVMSDASPDPIIAGAQYASATTATSTVLSPPPAQQATPPEAPPYNPNSKKVPPTANNDNKLKSKKNRWWSRVLLQLARNPQAAATLPLGAAAAGIGAVGVERAKNLSDGYNPLTGEIAPGTPFLRQPIGDQLSPAPDLQPNPQVDPSWVDPSSPATEQQRQIQSQVEPNESIDTPPGTGLSTETTRVSGRDNDDDDDDRCRLRPYKAGCGDVPGRSTPHHVVADRSFRAPGKGGAVYDGGVPHAEGLCICVEGATPKMHEPGSNMHGRVHLRQNEGEKALGQQGEPVGTATLVDLEGNGAKAAAQETGCDETVMKAQLRTYHQARGLGPNTRWRADPTGRLAVDPNSVGTGGGTGLPSDNVF
ncbi:PAAR-like domain-containing protein [Pseudovibrio sp. Alg231-02]|uniref:PAAR-like domain-containing protein n=1 Tax=Pseudovibrio sp. Alg231-02 TaxID=1922223 RepID=UPI000D54EB2C|nr:PAAR-like domain-containing protein [Pseudovibrio sp. Alg231-02]